MPASSAVFAVEFMSESVIAAGLRHGGISLIDQRVAATTMATAAAATTAATAGFASASATHGAAPEPCIVQHPSAISHIRRVDDVRIVVGGLRNSV